jgi:hypothetical protein
MSHTCAACLPGMQQGLATPRSTRTHCTAFWLDHEAGESVAWGACSSLDEAVSGPAATAWVRRGVGSALVLD